MHSGHPFLDLDTSIFRQFPSGRRPAHEFRAEAFNILIRYSRTPGNDISICQGLASNSTPQLRQCIGARSFYISGAFSAGSVSIPVTAGDAMTGQHGRGA